MDALQFYEREGRLPLYSSQNQSALPPSYDDVMAAEVKYNKQAADRACARESSNTNNSDESDEAHCSVDNNAQDFRTDDIHIDVDMIDETVRPHCFQIKFNYWTLLTICARLFDFIGCTGREG